MLEFTMTVIWLISNDFQQVQVKGMSWHSLTYYTSLIALPSFEAFYFKIFQTQVRLMQCKTFFSKSIKHDMTYMMYQ